MNKPTFTMMVGLPGSGKSTYAKELAERTNAKICSSDAIREEITGDINSQTNNEEVFKLLHKRIKEHLANSKSVIYDATNINSKRRRAFLSELKNIPCYKDCVIIAVPFEECCKRNESRERTIPIEVIERMYKNWNTPYFFEGWDSIKIKNDQYKNKLVENWVCDHLDFKQDNPHHSMELGWHCAMVGEFLNGDITLINAGLLHDCGKPFTKSFINSKGEETDIAHYYQHHCVGAYDSLFYVYPKDVNPLEVSTIINLHMQPYFWEKDAENGEKTMNKYKTLWGDELFERVMRLHEADKKAH